MLGSIQEGTHRANPVTLPFYMGKSARRFWQIHLSTAVLMMRQRRRGVFWFTVGRFIGPGAAISDWVEQDGLEARISVGNSTITPESPVVITLDLKNVSAKPFRIFKLAHGWENVEIHWDEKTSFEYVESICGEPKVPTDADFMVLDPARSLQHRFEASITADGLVDLGYMRYKLSGYKFPNCKMTALVIFSNGRDEPQDWDGHRDMVLAAIPVWHGAITTPSIPLTIGLPWTTRRIVSVIAYVFAAVVLTAMLSEFIIRRVEGRKP